MSHNCHSAKIPVVFLMGLISVTACRKSSETVIHKPESIELHVKNMLSILKSGGDCENMSQQIVSYQKANVDALKSLHTRLSEGIHPGSTRVRSKKKPKNDPFAAYRNIHPVKNDHVRKAREKTRTILKNASLLLGESSVVPRDLGKRCREYTPVEHAIDHLELVKAGDVEFLGSLSCFSEGRFCTKLLKIEAPKEIQLVRTEYSDLPKYSPVIALEMEAIRDEYNKVLLKLSRGVVPSEYKKNENAESMFIEPLYEAMNRVADRQKLLSQHSGDFDFTGLLTIIVDRQVPYRTLAEVAYTAGQARFGNFQLAVVDQDGNVSAIPVSMPRYSDPVPGSVDDCDNMFPSVFLRANLSKDSGDRKPVKKCLRLMVSIQKDRILINSELDLSNLIGDHATTGIPLLSSLPECKKEAAGKSRVPISCYDLTKLSRHLAAIRKAYPDDRKAILLAHAGTSAEVVICTLESMKYKNGMPLFEEVFLAYDVLNK